METRELKSARVHFDAFVAACVYQLARPSSTMEDD